MKTVARILTRLQGDTDGLFVGSLFKGGRDYFKPNTIYEIVDILGVLTIKEVGRATGAGQDNCSSSKLDYSKVQFTWNTNIGHVFDCGSSMFLTEKEWQDSKIDYENL
jgi:hypothetical protein